MTRVTGRASRARGGGLCGDGFELDRLRLNGMYWMDSQTEVLRRGGDVVDLVANQTKPWHVLLASISKSLLPRNSALYLSLHHTPHLSTSSYDEQAPDISKIRDKSIYPPWAAVTKSPDSTSTLRFLSAPLEAGLQSERSMLTMPQVHGLVGQLW